MMEQASLNVMIVDDSALMRNLIGRIIEGAGHVVAAKAMNGVFALKKLETIKPDIIILDLEMPEMNGIEFLRKRKELKIDIPVIILSSIARKGAEVTMEALNLGASDFVTKPSGSVSEDIHLVGDQLLELISVYGGRGKGPGGQSLHREPEVVLPPREAPVLQPLPARPSGQLPHLQPPRPHSGLQILAIGISTGGPNALRQVFQALPAQFPLPIVVVQHMPAGFTLEFARSLDRACALEVKEAEEGDLVRPGRILIAPGDHHIEVERKSLGTVVHLNQNPVVNGHRPSAGVLFKSVARAFGSSAFAVIMTGMGKDGSVEMGEIYRAGGLTIAQDEASSVVYGMPKVATDLGHAERVVSLDAMAATIVKLANDYR